MTPEQIAEALRIGHAIDADLTVIAIFLFAILIFKK